MRTSVGDRVLRHQDGKTSTAMGALTRKSLVHPPVPPGSLPTGRHIRRMIRDQLAGRRLFITGTTGFLGTNLLERLLRTVPDCEVVLLVRPGRRSTVAQRVQREILKNDAFDRLRADLGPGADGKKGGGFAEMAARRVTAVAGDVSADGLGL